MEDGLFSDYAVEFELPGKFLASLTQQECMTIAGKNSIGISISKAIDSLKKAQGSIFNTIIIISNLQDLSDSSSTA